MLVSNRSTNILLVLILAVGVGIVAMLASGARGGPLDPPAAPSATGTLPQVEPRMPIPPVGWNGTFPIVISQYGSYFLTQNLTGVANTDGIDITASNVTIDLDGFTLTGAAQTGEGIRDGAGRAVVRNGTLSLWAKGLNLFGSAYRVSGIDVSASALGMDVDGATVEDCRVANNVIGVTAFDSIIRRCAFTGNTSDALSLSQENSVENNYFGQNGSPGAGSWDIAVHFSDNVIRDNYSDALFEKFVGIFPGAVANTLMSNRYRCATGVVDNSGGFNSIPVGATLEGTNVCF